MLKTASETDETMTAWAAAAATGTMRVVEYIAD